jgi:phosphate starvation-inducible PhoH-like protein
MLTVDQVDPVDFFGERNIKLNMLRAFFPDLTITSRGTNIKISGDKKQAQRAKQKMELMLRYLKKNKHLTKRDIETILNSDNHADLFYDQKTAEEYTIVHGRGGKVIKAKTLNQIRLVDCVRNHDVCFAVGPAGTGKTYTAVALAVKALKSKQVKRIILTRPAVEAGESLGFLPGDLKEKIDPYLRPLYDALNDMIPRDKLNQLMEKNIIEIAPLAFMRGRTLDHSFIILDEAQNATTTQLKMFLTRLGPNAKCIITGDLSQIDLPRTHQSGLYHTIKLLKKLRGIGVVRLTSDDVIRHRLVKDIIHAFEGQKAQKDMEKELFDEEE